MPRIALFSLLLTASLAHASPQDLLLLRPLFGSSEADGSLRVAVDREAYRLLREHGAARVVAFPLPDGSRLDFDLEAFSVIAPGARFFDVGPRGQRQVEPPGARFFRGEVFGHPGSLVVLGLFQDRVAGTIHLDGRSYGFGPRSLSLSSPEAHDLRVWDRADETGRAICDATGDDEATRAAAAAHPLLPVLPRVPLGGDPQLRLDLALDTTTEWCAHFGNDMSAAQLYLLGLAAQISAIYDAEISVLVQVPFLRTFCGAADPYTDGLTSLSDRAQLLSELSTEWSSNMGAVARTVAHLFTVSSTSSAGGLASTITCSGSNCVPVLCNLNFGYGVNMLPATGGSAANFEVQVSAHELGHNHSSPHTNCLQNGGSQWLSTCAVESCGSNPWCQTTGCYPGPVNTNLTGTLMSTGCNSRVSQFDATVDSILRGAAESASCVEAAGLPGAVTEPWGLRLSRVTACPGATLLNDDGTVNFTWSACPGCQYAWIKRFTPSCYPFRITSLQAMVTNVSVGRPIRLLVYVDPAGTGDPANAVLASSQDVAVQVVGPPSFNSYPLASPVTVPEGDVYLGVYDLQASTPAPSLAAMDTSTSGNSYSAINATAPSAFAPRPEGTWLIRASGGAVAAGSLRLDWGAPCNEATTPGQDFEIYRGDLGVFDEYTSLTCSTGGNLSHVAEGASDNSFFLVVPRTSASEGSYGQTSAGLERPAAALACATRDFETCP